MILQQLHIDGFGKLSNVDFTFSDNLNLICGNNEAGKSTLCSFIFHMLYGLERGRGRASRYDAYIHYLPWNATAYGGSLTFLSDGFTWFLERSFLADSRFIRLTRLDDGKLIPDPEKTLSRLLSSVSESVFKTLFFLSGQSISDGKVFSELLQRYTQNPSGSHTAQYSSTRAIQVLKRQKKELLQKLSGVSSGDLLRTDEDLHALELQISELTVSSKDTPAAHFESTSDVQRKPSVFRLIIGLFFVFIGILLLLSPSLWTMIGLPISNLVPAAFSLLTGFVGVVSSCRRTVTDVHPDDCPHLPSSELGLLLSRRESLLEQKEWLTAQFSADSELSQQIRSIDLAIDTISALSSDIHQLYTPDLQRSFLRHARVLTGRPFNQLFMDESFCFTLLEENHHVPLEGLSRGTITQLQFACRLAAIELLYPHADLPILLDDVFATTDDTRLSVLLSRLNTDYPGQKILFSCQKREAVILSQHSLPYHLIQL